MMIEAEFWERLHRAVERTEPLTYNGRITQVIGLSLESQGPTASLGEICYLYPPNSERPVLAEVVGFRDHRVILMPLGDVEGLSPGSEVVASGRAFTVEVGRDLLGRVLNGLGEPIDGGGPIEAEKIYPALSPAPNPLERRRIQEPLPLGVRVIDGLLTCGRGQRIGIFAGSGVGKSTLLGMVARYAEADVNVIALVGERGREVREFLDKDLGDGLARSVVVVATSDEPAMVRLKAAQVATAVAEFFRDQGLNVLFLMDSVTRLATAQREIGLAIGEPPTTRGYTPSVFALLPRLLERSGNAQRGSITGFYTVLVEGDDMNEPVADAVRSILDGHLVLSRELAAKDHYPAIDLLQSVSRVMPDIVTSEHRQQAEQVRSWLATYRQAEDLINIGAYAEGANPEIDRARAAIGAINEFLRQDVSEMSPFAETEARLSRLVS